MHKSRQSEFGLAAYGNRGGCLRRNRIHSEGKRMLPQELTDKLNNARQLRVDSANAETAVATARQNLTDSQAAAQKALDDAQATAITADSNAATATADALQAVTDWMNSPVTAEGSAS